MTCQCTYDGCNSEATHTWWSGDSVWLCDVHDARVREAHATGDPVRIAEEAFLASAGAPDVTRRYYRKARAGQQFAQAGRAMVDRAFGTYDIDARRDRPRIDVSDYRMPEDYIGIYRHDEGRTIQVRPGASVGTMAHEVAHWVQRVREGDTACFGGISIGQRKDVPAVRALAERHDALAAEVFAGVQPPEASAVYPHKSRWWKFSWWGSR
jgi:hypothetical protein